jgi:osmotically-inducible protein OsmY
MVKGFLLYDEAIVSPAEVAEQILSESPYRAIRRLKCSYHDGSLVLSGHVSHYYLKALAQIALQNLDGVRQISNDIEVLPDV